MIRFKEVVLLCLVSLIPLVYIPSSEGKFNSTRLYQVTGIGNETETPEKAGKRLPSTQKRRIPLYMAVPHDYCGILSKLIRSKYNWQDVSRAWQERMRAYGYWICHRDCGGGGDCLYRSIISSMNMTNMTVSMLRSQIADEFIGINSTVLRSLEREKNNTMEVMIDSEGSLTGNSSVNTGLDSQSLFKGNLTKELKQENASPAQTWNDTFFLEQMNILMSLELAGEWQDSWSPVEIMSNDFIEGMDVSTSIKKARMVHYYLSKQGNTHWGNQWDVNIMEKMFKVKIMIFWKNRGIIYPTLGSLEKYKGVVLIYYDDVIGHFQVIGIKKFNTRNSDFISIFRASNTPSPLKEIFLRDTHRNLFN